MVTIEDLYEERIWVMWQKVYKNKKLTKVPCNEYRQAISITSPPYSTYKQIWQKAQNNGLGIGLVFTGNGLVGIDMDKVLDEDEKTAMYWVHKFASYTELSPSATGLHILVKGTIPGKRRRKGRYEIYNDKRFFTFTGKQISYDVIREVDLTDFYNEMIEPPHEEKTYTPQITHEYTTVSEIIKHFKNNNHFIALYYGNIKGYSSYSEAELAFCSIIAKATQDYTVIDSLMRSSYLYRPKWDELRGEETYGQRTIRTALR